MLQEKTENNDSPQGLYLSAPEQEQPVFVPDSAFIRLEQVIQLYPIGKSTFWAGVKSGRFPQPVKLGPNTTAWKVGDIRQLLNKASQSQNCGEN